jgi:hypothetical protein
MTFSSRPFVPLAILCAFLLSGHTSALDQEAPAESAGMMTVEEATALAREIAPRIEQIRGLTFKTPVPVRIVDDEAARAHFEKRIKKFYTDRRLWSLETVYGQLGLLPPGTDMAAEYLNVLEEQAGGYYDPDTDTFFVLDDQPRAVASVLMAHELTHALDDQHYEIDALAAKVSDQTDRATALNAVVEGSGTLVMSRFMMEELRSGRLTAEALAELQRSESGRAEKLMASPLLLQRSLLLPYILGQAFLVNGDMSRLAGEGGGEDIDRAFRQIPHSSEQILHPGKYWDESTADRPLDVRLPDLSTKLGRGWSLSAKDTLGEAYLAILTGTGPLNVSSPDIVDPARWTNEAAAGWGGDLWHLYTKRKKNVSLLATLWDSEQDALEFAEALTPVDGRSHVHRGRAVVLIGGDSGGRAAGLCEAALDAVLSPEAEP